MGGVADAVTWREIRRERVIYDDADVLAIDKPGGLSVMGERHGTDLVRLAADAGEELHPAHRIDKVTSGVCLLARSLTVHGDLTRQFNKREVAKRYLAVVLGRDIPPAAPVELPLLTASSGRVRIAAPRDAIRFDAESATYAVAPAAVSAQRHYPSTTRFEVEVAGEDAAVARGPEFRAVSFDGVVGDTIAVSETWPRMSP